MWREKLSPYVSLRVCVCVCVCVLAYLTPVLSDKNPEISFCSAISEFLGVIQWVFSPFSMKDKSRGDNIER